MSIYVAPFAGAWIEIGTPGVSADIVAVAPFAGAWIEIPYPRRQTLIE